MESFIRDWQAGSKTPTPQINYTHMHTSTLMGHVLSVSAWSVTVQLYLPAADYLTQFVVKLDKNEKEKGAEEYLYQSGSELIFGTIGPWLWTDSEENGLWDF